jgi:hypothetical protein
MGLFDQFNLLEAIYYSILLTLRLYSSTVKILTIIMEVSMENDSRDITAWMCDPEEYTAELAEIILTQLSINQELEGENA